MIWGSIKMNTLTDNSRAHIAEMMIQGTVMGITSLKTTLSEKPENDDPEIISLLEQLIELEEGFEEKLKTFSLKMFLPPPLPRGSFSFYNFSIFIKIHKISKNHK